jgi:D-lactate dehydrogenase
MRTLMYSAHNFSERFYVHANENKHELTFTEDALTVSTADRAKGFQAVTLFTSDDGSADVLDRLSYAGIKYIALRSVGHDHVNLTKASSLAIRVANVPAYSPYSIAEHAVALLMALNRKIVLGQRLMRQNDFRLDQLIGIDLFGKTVGIIGTGKIGSAFANIMHGFGCNLLAYDIKENTKLIRDTKIVYASIEQICKVADVISIHCPLNESTTYLFDKEAFARMKKGVILINTSRGGIVNTHDLLNALDDGIVESAGLDVYEYEKPIFFYNHGDSAIKDDLFLQLVSHPRVLLTGHQAFLTHEALTGIASTTIANLDAWERSGTSHNDLTRNE